MKPLVLIGDLRTGKTTWARVYGEHMCYTNGVPIPPMWDANGCAVFDDVNVKKFFVLWRDTRMQNLYRSGTHMINTACFG